MVSKKILRFQSPSRVASDVTPTTKEMRAVLDYIDQQFRSGNNRRKISLYDLITAFQKVTRDLWKEKNDDRRDGLIDLRRALEQTVRQIHQVSLFVILNWIGG